MILTKDEMIKDTITVINGTKEKIRSFIMKLWHSAFPATPDFYFNRQPFEQPVIPVVEKKPRVARQKTLQKMLGGIEYVFESVGLPTEWAWAHTSKDTIIALRKLGPHISKIPPIGDLDSRIKLKTLDGKWGALMFVAYEKQEKHKGFMNPVFCYSVLLKKAPWYVGRHNKKLPIFECGASWRDENDKLFWGNWHVVVDKTTGSVDVCSCLNYTHKRVKNMSYTQKEWGLPPMATAGFSVEASRQVDVLKAIFVDCFEAWQIVNTHWKVCVSKQKQRVTWTVPQDETKHFFADRDTTVTDASGKKKKIIHHVVQHERITASGKASMVREHIRGLNKFDWRGYEVNVIAPKFHVTAHDFDVGAYEEDELPAGKKMVFASKVGKVLADLEQRGERKELPALR